MTEQRTTTDTYRLPGSHEAILTDTLETTPSEAELARAAIDQAIGAHMIDTADVDTHRIESFGATMLAAAEQQTARQFDPTNTEHMVACGAHVVRMRTTALTHHAQQKNDR